VAGQNPRLGVNKNGIVEAEFADAGSDLRDLRIGVRSGIVREGNEFFSIGQISMR
jgi:hypothetical protein